MRSGTAVLPEEHAERMWRVEISFQILNGSDLHPQPDLQSDRTKLYWLLWKSNSSRNETACVSWTGQDVKTFKASYRNLFSSWVNEAFSTGAVLNKFGRSRRMCPKHVWSCLIAVPSLIITKTTNSFVSLVSESTSVFIPASWSLFLVPLMELQRCDRDYIHTETCPRWKLLLQQQHQLHYVDTYFIWSCLFGLTCSASCFQSFSFVEHIITQFNTLGGWGVFLAGLFRMCDQQLGGNDYLNPL